MNRLEQNLDGIIQNLTEYSGKDRRGFLAKGIHPDQIDTFKNKRKSGDTRVAVDWDARKSGGKGKKKPVSFAVKRFKQEEARLKKEWKALQKKNPQIRPGDDREAEKYFEARIKLTQVMPKILIKKYGKAGEIARARIKDAFKDPVIKKIIKDMEKNADGRPTRIPTLLRRVWMADE